LTPQQRLQAIPAQAPDWLVRLLTPFLAKHIAREMTKRHPDLEPGQIGARMRADLGAHLREHGVSLPA